MAAEFLNTVPGQEAEIWRFLSDVFAMPDAPAALAPAAMKWKYFESHPWWPEGRSYILKTEQGIAAHGCMSPVRYTHNGVLVESHQVIDWGAGRLIPGAGVLVYRKSLELNGGTLLAIGGSEDAAKIIPQLKWFSRRNDLQNYALPLRPWLHFAKGPKRVRAFARLARNVSWKWSRPRVAPASWTCRGARPAEDIFSPRLGDFVPMVRTRAWFDYLLQCPVTRTELVILENAGRPAGHAFLSYAGGSARVADFVVSGDGQTQAFAALLRYVAAQPGTAEITAASSIEETCRVFSECGLRYRGSAKVYLADPRKLLPPEARIEVTPLVGDAFYMVDRSHPFVC